MNIQISSERFQIDANSKKKTEAATDVNKKPQKRKEPDGDGRGEREEASKPKKKTIRSRICQRYKPKLATSSSCCQSLDFQWHTIIFLG